MTVRILAAWTMLCCIWGGSRCHADEREPLFLDPINVSPSPIAGDPSVKYDYDIVYVRARRAGDLVHKRYYSDFSQSVTCEPGIPPTTPV